ncbi:protein phosphatase methylesterase [Thelephora ganbajun]|uniref:Protein phosphatase methylesterase n=1 Tax=Thelephora ganbajun TaxID=370292 RepID=A0ACB6ZLB3_THEGA|nr:protein phosphatase methylesterase [Thelephora ganbajun]
MSNLYRSAIYARLSKLPPMPPPEDLEDGDEGEEEVDTLGSLLSSPPAPTSLPRSGSGSTSAKSSHLDAFRPTSALGYFDQALEINVPSVQLNFRVYYTPPKAKGGTVLVCHHGAGYSALSFACFAKEVTGLSNGECGILAFDVRRHGKTVPTPESQTPDVDANLDTITLVNDCMSLLTTVFPHPAASPSLLLVGHSLGGSVCVRVVPLLLERKYRLTGVAVLDVVEEFTLDALPNMHALLHTRPTGFGSIEEGIEWHFRTHAIRNVTSARISIPTILVPSVSGNPPPWKWRTPLEDTAPYWTNWFTSLSSLFLSCKTARLLVLAGTERLDRELMIGQMQGKFQLEVISGVGHMLHEDNPTRLAEVLVEFWRRNERVLVGVKKVGET